MQMMFNVSLLFQLKILDFLLLLSTSRCYGTYPVSFEVSIDDWNFGLNKLRLELL